MIDRKLVCWLSSKLARCLVLAVHFFYGAKFKGGGEEKEREVKRKTGKEKRRKQGSTCPHISKLAYWKSVVKTNKKTNNKKDNKAL